MVSKILIIIPELRTPEAKRPLSVPSMVPELRTPEAKRSLSVLPSFQSVLGHIANPNKRRCSVMNCAKLIKSKGVCTSHGGGTRCIVDGCTKHAKARQRCIAHGGRRCCSVVNCSKHAKLRGKCILHSQEEKKGLQGV